MHALTCCISTPWQVAAQSSWAAAGWQQAGWRNETRQQRRASSLGFSLGSSSGATQRSQAGQGGSSDAPPSGETRDAAATTAFGRDDESLALELLPDVSLALLHAQLHVCVAAARRCPDSIRAMNEARESAVDSFTTHSIHVCSVAIDERSLGAEASCFPAFLRALYTLCLGRWGTEPRSGSSLFAEGQHVAHMSMNTRRLRPHTNDTLIRLSSISSHAQVRLLLRRVLHGIPQPQLLARRATRIAASLVGAEMVTFFRYESCWFHVG